MFDYNNNILNLLCCLLLALFFCGSCFAADFNTDVDYSNWIANNHKYMSQLPVNQVVLPGTHASGSYAITKRSSFANDGNIPEWVKEVADALPSWLSHNTIMKIIASWAKTQESDITWQLQHGIRYFDMDVCNKDGTFYECHALLGDTVDNIIEQLHQFSREHPLELIVLNFHKFYDFGYEDHKALAYKLSSKFQGMLVSPKFGPTVLLRAVETWGQRIIIVYNDDFIVSGFPVFWPSKFINIKEPNSTSLSVLYSGLNEEISSTRGGQLFGLSGVIIPDANRILDGLLPGFPGSSKSLAQIVNSNVDSWLANEWDEKGLNIISENWFDTSNFLKTIIALNDKKAVNIKTGKPLPDKPTSGLVGEFNPQQVTERIEKSYRETQSS